MKILIIGASGKTGNLILSKALAKGYQIKVFARDISKFNSYNNLEVFQGDLNDVEKLSQVMEGVDAVLITLGNKASQMSKPLFTFAIPNIIKAMEKVGVKRVINLSALGVGETYANAGFPCNIFAKTILKENFADHEKGEGNLETSNLYWTTIHPALLYTGKNESHKPKFFNAITKSQVWGLSMTSRQDIAALMLDIINDKSTYGQKLILVSKRIF